MKQPTRRISYKKHTSCHSSQDWIPSSCACKVIKAVLIYWPMVQCKEHTKPVIFQSFSFAYLFTILLYKAWKCDF